MEFETPIVLEIDIVYTAEIGDVLDLIQRHSGTIQRFEANGPAGGNPCLILAFPTSLHASGFVTEYDPEADLEQYIV